ncbi:uncharacterized protein N7482_002379 [Penicillium canariense]|uniref:Uncharacterized protein n=1 Tax=Penicillium canariense TaxID=189055 RepID=A0A9W9IHI9_9EURO|nr:uncharacterized protein N7482_002379 [Penicillium canariense]KAJ5176502.1 hypothetical protein N7482_002379 [Penicillium canariense]
MAMPLRLRPAGLTRKFLSRPSTSTAASRCCAPTSRSYATSERLPKIADSSVWTAMVPRFIRTRRSRKTGETKEWNPATFYIVMFTLIGSQAIRLLTLKNGYASYSRSADAKIELLKEVIERVQKGEKVDVEKILGTGDEAQELEWEDVLRQIEQEDAQWHSKQKAEKESKQSAREPEKKESAVPDTAGADGDGKKKTQPTRKMNFF